MSEEPINSNDPLQSLTQVFLLNFPLKAARRLEAMSPEEVAAVLQQQKVHVIARVMEKLAPQLNLLVLGKLPPELAVKVLELVEVGVALNMLARLPEEDRVAFLALMPAASAQEFRALLDYPENTVGRLMNPAVLAFNLHTTAGQAIQLLRQQKIESLHQLFLLSDDLRLHARVDLHKLLLADPQTSLSALSVPVLAVVQDMAPKEDVHEKLEHHDVDVLPVVDVDGRLVGVIEGQELRDAVREDVATDMQTMVGASRDERALSSSFFAVRKRLPWLQINLLTAFLAAAVVGMFEDTIAQFTALAVLLPISAGQSGNAGAQALAVTMRGLTLREITMRHWYKVMLKEFGAGFINGIGIAITCSLGVFLWSRSMGLAIVMALAMVVSMTIAGISGALVPILLKRFGLDPAQSSSIVLTTVTDIAGFMSFLGIATLMASSL